MTKHIIGQSGLQTIVILGFIFCAQLWIKESSDPRLNEYGIRNGDLIYFGMLKDPQGFPVYQPFTKLTPSRHMTIVFNLFVFFQIWNMLCAKKIDDELNIFEGFFTNYAFLVIWLIIFGLQIVFIEAFGTSFKVHVNGLTSEHWTWSVGVALLAFPMNFILKFVPDNFFLQMGEEDPSDVEAAKKDYEVLKRLKTRDLSGSQRFVENKQGGSFKK